MKKHTKKPKQHPPTPLEMPFIIGNEWVIIIQNKAGGLA